MAADRGEEERRRRELLFCLQFDLEARRTHGRGVVLLFCNGDACFSLKKESGTYQKRVRTI